MNTAEIYTVEIIYRPFYFIFFPLHVFVHGVIDLVCSQNCYCLYIHSTNAEVSSNGLFFGHVLTNLFPFVC
jgi:hypothetical protein